LGGQKRTSCTSFTQKDRHNLAILTPFHRDRIKLRTGHLVISYEQQLPTYQKLCARKAKYKLPKSICKGARTWLAED
jgi:hypothetical protein